MKVSKKQKIRFLIIYILLNIATVLTIKLNLPKLTYTVPGEIGVMAFYQLFDMETFLYLFTAFVLISPSVISIDFFQHKEGFSNLILTRINSKKYLKSAIIQSFAIGFILMLAVQLTSLLFLQFLYDPLLNIFTYQTNVFFSKSPVLELCYYILFSSMGYGLFLVFLTVISFFIKNEYLYRCSGILILITTYLLYPLISTIFFGIIPISLDSMHIPIRSLISFILPVNLYTPGTTFRGEAPYTGWYSFFSSAFFYGIIIFSIYKYLVKNNEIMTR